MLFIPNTMQINLHAKVADFIHDKQWPIPDELNLCSPLLSNW
jgi:hypothetical protein